MKKVHLTGSKELITNEILGTMYFGSKVDSKTSFEILDIYYEHGGNIIDSANKYASWIPLFNGGESEALIGKWLQKKRNRNDLLISSKVGFPYRDIPRSLKADIIISECEKSLKRMNIDTIDIYFAHAFDSNTPIEETMEAFHTLKKQGKIRYMAASNFQAWRVSEANLVAELNGWEGIVALQQRHSYLEPSLRSGFGNQLLITPEIEDYCLTKEITLMGYSTLLGGLYSNSTKELPIQYQSSNTESRLEILNRLSRELNITVNQLVLAWMINSTPQVLPTITASTKEQIVENIAASDITVTSECMEQLNNIKATKVY